MSKGEELVLSQIQLVRAEDWEGLYVRGLLFDEGHILDGETYIKLIHEYNTNLTGQYEVYNVDQDWMEEMGSLPAYFSEIPSGYLDLIEKK